MLAWQLALKQRGLLTAIVSNMGDSVHENMVRELDWLSRFDVLVWSYQLGMAKPDPAIYRYALERLGTGRRRRSSSTTRRRMLKPPLRWA